MPNKIGDVLKAVKQRIKADTFKSMVEYVKEANPVLWGEKKPANFLKHMVALTIYKDLHAYGYQKVLKKVKLNYNINHKSLEHNIKKIKRC